LETRVVALIPIEGKTCGDLLSITAFVAKIWEFRRFLAIIKSSLSDFEMIGEKGEIHEI
jgi:hypothetical protein